MNKRYFLWFLSLAVVFLMACSDEKERVRCSNYIKISTQSATTFTEDSEMPVVVDVMLAFTLDRPESVSFELVGNEGDLLYIDNPRLDFQAGDKVKQLKVFSNRKSLVNLQQVVTLRVKDFTAANMAPWEEGIRLTVKPDAAIPELDEEQLEMIRGYKERLGLDVERLMGRLQCKVRVIFPIDEVGEDGETVFSDKEVQEFQAESIVTLSEEATSERPVLKMVDNPMGWTSIVWKVLQKEIAINNQVGTSFPSVVEALAYQPEKESFHMALDRIRLNADGGVDFVGPMPDAYGDTITVVPFEYSFSAWKRQKQMADEGKTVDVVVKDPSTGEVLYTEPETPMASLIEQGMTFNPEYHLISSDISADGWESGMWKEPKSKVDFDKGSWDFAFSWDHMNSSGWTLVEVSYQLHPVKQ